MENFYLSILLESVTRGKYARWYEQIIKFALARAPSKKEARKKLEYVETHHILPKAFKAGGEKDPDNLVYLTPREHFICHRLLAKITTGSVKTSMNLAALLMSYKHTSNGQYKITSRVYAQLKSAGPQKKKCSDEMRAHLRQLYAGKTRPESHKIAMRNGWERRKHLGFEPHNKGKTFGPTATAIKCIFISPAGEIFRFDSFRQGCLSLGLPPCKISQVKTGKLSDYKGWKVSVTDASK